uniref:Uncharacterized protein n=1 Tax=Aegilops tauschii subsp. strangulata TaxID=200361 RepID=A0A453P8A8_AEGTS
MSTSQLLLYFLLTTSVAHNGLPALAILLPFSCILGLFSSLTTTSMVARRCVDLRGDPVPLRLVLHASVLQICKQSRAYSAHSA